MKGSDFKRWAERGCRIYGEDPWFFVRELAQNARDAGARHLTFASGRNPAGEEWITCRDDGQGMTLEHAREYLFRLYASSKEDQRNTAGEYGIGFWSVLRFAPREVRIESRTERGAFAVLLDADFNVREVPATLTVRGTLITLVRTARETGERAYRQAVLEAVRRYCRHLRRNDRGASPLPVSVDGRDVLAPIVIKGPVSLSFRDGPVEGAVGLAPRPAVELLARGLPVWRGLLLDELSYRGGDHDWRSEIAQGLAPVFVLNGNRLNVVMARNTVVDDAALARVRRSAKKALDRLVRHHVQRTFPAGPLGRLLGQGARLWRWLGRLPVAVALPILAVVALVVTGTLVGPRIAARLGWEAPAGWTAEEATAVHGVGPESADLESQAPISTITTLPTEYKGSLVEAPRYVHRVTLRYDPPYPRRFKLMTADYFDPVRGFVAELDTRRKAPLPKLDCRDAADCLDVALTIQQTGPIAAPLPTGYGLVTGTLGTQDGIPLPGWLDGQGQSIVLIPEGTDTLHFRAAPVMTPEQRREVQETLPLQRHAALSEPLRQRLAAASALPLPQQVAVAVEVARALVRYDDSAATATAYRELNAAGDWLTFVAELGRGDCDVMNAVVVLAMRAYGHPARLAIGVVGENGRSRPGLHAWAEVYDGSHWLAADATENLRPREVSQSRNEAGGAGREAASGARPPARNEGGDAGREAASGARPPARNEGGDAGREAASGARPQARNEGGDAGGEAASEVRPQAWDEAGDEGAEAASEVRPQARNGAGGYLWLLAVALLAGLLMAWGFLRRRGGARLTGSPDRETAERMLGEMALAAASQPAAWQHAEAIWSHPLLPLLGGRRISLRRAAALARLGRLYVGRAENDLARAAARGGSLVADGSDRWFGPVGYQLAGSRSLDQVAGLEPVVGGVGGLLGAANDVLARSGFRGISLVMCPGLIGREVLDVDLGPVRLPADYTLPPRFVAVGRSEAVEELAARHAAEPALAVYELVAFVAARSRVLRPRQERLRAAVARALLLTEGTA